MAKPVILTVDDERQVLNAIQRDLRKQYANDYRIVKASSGPEALDATKQFKQRNTPVALFLADQRMPEMSGVEFLKEAGKLYPDARKALLTAYADTEAAIASINQIGLDYYLMKPWDPPEQNLYPILDDLLSDWEATVPIPYDGGWPAHYGRRPRMMSRIFWPGTGFRTSGSISRLIRKPASWLKAQHRAIDNFPLSFSLTANFWLTQIYAPWPTRSACAPRLRKLFTI